VNDSQTTVFGQPGDTNAVVSRPETRSSSRRSSSGHRSGRHRHRSSTRPRALLYLLFLGFSIVVIMLIAMYLLFAYTRANDEIVTLRGQLDSKQAELLKANASIQDIEAEFAALVDGRLPHLQELEFDKIINIPQRYIKNIVFTETRLDGTKSYEYRIVAENNERQMVAPIIRVLLFDRSGVQISSAVVEGNKILRSGESFTFHDQLDLFIDAVPVYFYIDIRGVDDKLKLNW